VRAVSGSADYSTRFDPRTPATGASGRTGSGRTSCSGLDKVCGSAQGAPAGRSRYASFNARPRLSWSLKSIVFVRAHCVSPERSAICPWQARKAVHLAQRIIEMLIGRLITDEQFRFEFLQDPENTLLALSDRGLELSRTEIAALVNTEPALWARTADAIDPRLQKASLKTEARVL
jgi:hypothetical protein